ncbi:MAG TPA: NAD(+)/NADH kinase [Terriglobales bacterium]|nr:NAD(+)/NADH kinase [Terriglobales bacterium]
MKINLIASPIKDSGMQVARQTASLLTEWGADVWVDEAVAHFFEGNVVSAPKEACLSGADAVIAIGGDGTFLKAATAAAQVRAPVLGVNLGRTGFLAEVETGELQLLRRLFEGDYKVEQRMMLQASVRRGGKVRYRGLALNDVVLHRGMVSRLLTMQVLCNGGFISTVRGDGLVISTPTGSTGYSLSAGGPIIDPKTACIAMVPVCSHSLASRAIIFEAASKLAVTPEMEEGRDAYLSLDGAASFLLLQGDVVAIQKAPVTAQIIRLKPDNFYEILQNKFKEGDGT